MNKDTHFIAHLLENISRGSEAVRQADRERIKKGLPRLTSTEKEEILKQYHRLAKPIRNLGSSWTCQAVIHVLNQKYEVDDYIPWESYNEIFINSKVPRTVAEACNLLCTYITNLAYVKICYTSSHVRRYKGIQEGIYSLLRHRLINDPLSFHLNPFPFVDGANSFEKANIWGTADAVKSEDLNQVEIVPDNYYFELRWDLKPNTMEGDIERKDENIYITIRGILYELSHPHYEEIKGNFNSHYKSLLLSGRSLPTSSYRNRLYYQSDARGRLV
jgi:hypothetical protein